MKKIEDLKRSEVVGSLVAIVLAAAICVEGYYIYLQSQEIKMLVSQLENEALLAPLATVAGMSRVNVAGPVAAFEVSVGDMVVHDESDRYVVETRMPDVDGSNIQIDLDGRRLRVSAEERQAMTDIADSSGEAVKEGFIAKVEREITLPGPVSSSGLTHEYGNGVLTVTIPKSHA